MPLVRIRNVHTENISLSDVYCIPKLAMNLTSVGQLCDSGNSANFFPNTCYIQDLKPKEVIGTCHRETGDFIFWISCDMLVMWQPQVSIYPDFI